MVSLSPDGQRLRNCIQQELGRSNLPVETLYSALFPQGEAGKVTGKKLCVQSLHWVDLSGTAPGTEFRDLAIQP